MAGRASLRSGPADRRWQLPFAREWPRSSGRVCRGHIPGAVFFDIDDVCDPSSPLPHMLPPPDLLAKMHALGIADGDHVVVYDQPGLCGAARLVDIPRVRSR